MGDTGQIFIKEGVPTSSSTVHARVELGPLPVTEPEDHVHPHAHDEARVRGALDGLAPCEHSVEPRRPPGPLDSEDESGNGRRNDPQPACHDRHPAKNVEPPLRPAAGSSAETPKCSKARSKPSSSGGYRANGSPEGSPRSQIPHPSSISARVWDELSSITSRSSCFHERIVRARCNSKVNPRLRRRLPGAGASLRRRHHRTTRDQVRRGFAIEARSYDRGSAAWVSSAAATNPMPEAIAASAQTRLRLDSTSG
jgi:hypothetical protein